MATPQIHIKEEVKGEFDDDPNDSAMQLDADLYEDAGDLDLNNSSQATYLTRVPKYLWQYLKPENSRQDGSLGTIRVEGGPDNPKRLSLMLYKSDNTKDVVPLEYSLQLAPDPASNTFIFTEQDLPGFQKKTRSFVAGPKESMPYSQALPRQLGNDKSKSFTNRVDKGQRFQGGYKRAVPKRTAITGKVKQDLNCLPVENEAYRQAISARTRQKAQPLRETQVFDVHGNYHTGNVVSSGSASHGFQQFIKPIGGQRPKGQDSKATRMAKNELLDLIQGCFKVYRYWPLKRLRAELQQPEAYLKETLEEVAVLIRQGQYAMTWRLKDAYNMEQYASAADAQAPRAAAGPEGLSDFGEDASEDDGEDVKMENVL